MNAIDVIRRAQDLPLVDEDGEGIEMKLLPALTEGEILELERQCAMPLPREVCELASFCGGIDGIAVEFDFRTAPSGFGMEEILPHGLSFAADGFGNYWVLDLTPDTKESAPIYYASHDAPVLLYQSPNLGEYFAEVVRMSMPPHHSLIDDVHEDRLFNVWQRNPATIEVIEALRSSDPKLREFAASLDERFHIIDLRAAEPGMGFSWGRFGPRTELRRHGYERIFAYAKPKKTGRLARIFG